MNNPNDLFAQWAKQHSEAGETPSIPAATVVVLRDNDGIEVLMLRRNSKLEFVGGMWVFPGGRVDPEDHDGSGDPFVAAKNAAVREAQEESGQTVDSSTLVDFAHWMPPPITPKRFATWFFVARASGEEVTIDDGEIKDHDWMRPVDALRRRDEHDIELAPPTWVTLHDLQAFDDVDSALRDLHERETRFYMTRIARSADGVPIAMWAGDAGYDDRNPDAAGARHRLVMASRSYAYENSVHPN